MGNRLEQSAVESTVAVLRQAALVVVIGTFVGCAPMPGAPTTADIERGLSGTSSSGPSIGGRVTDAATGTPVVGATVTVQGRSALTAVSGSFGFDDDMTAGIFPVKITHPQYVDVEREVEIKPYQWVHVTMRHQ